MSSDPRTWAWGPGDLGPERVADQETGTRTRDLGPGTSDPVEETRPHELGPGAPGTRARGPGSGPAAAAVAAAEVERERAADQEFGLLTT